MVVSFFGKKKCTPRRQNPGYAYELAWCTFATSGHRLLVASHIISLSNIFHPQGAALLENNEASPKLTTANGGTFTLRSSRLSSQSRYSMLDQ